MKYLATVCNLKYCNWAASARGMSIQSGTYGGEKLVLSYSSFSTYVISVLVGLWKFCAYFSILPSYLGSEDIVEYFLESDNEDNLIIL